MHVKFMGSLSIQRNTMMACEVHGESEHSEEHNDVHVKFMGSLSIQRNTMMCM